MENYEVHLIRGEIDTELQIEFISFDSDIDNRKIVTLKREEVKLEDRAAQSQVFEMNDNKIGVIDLPSFIDLRNMQIEILIIEVAEDIRNILNKFNEDNVDAVVLDLRNNGVVHLLRRVKLLIIYLIRTNCPSKAKKRIHSTIWRLSCSSSGINLLLFLNRYSASASKSLQVH